MEGRSVEDLGYSLDDSGCPVDDSEEMAEGEEFQIEDSMSVYRQKLALEASKLEEANIENSNIENIEDSKDQEGYGNIDVDVESCVSIPDDKAEFDKLFLQECSLAEERQPGLSEFVNYILSMSESDIANLTEEERSSYETTLVNFDHDLAINKRVYVELLRQQSAIFDPEQTARLQSNID